MNCLKSSLCVLFFDRFKTWQPVEKTACRQFWTFEERSASIIDMFESFVTICAIIIRYILQMWRLFHYTVQFSLLFAHQLRDLNMAGIALKDADLELIQQAVFQRRQSMSRLNFSGNPRIGRAGFGSIGTMISKSVFLSYLNVSGCPFTARTAETFKDAIAACKLKTLIMHSCNLKVRS